MDSFQVDTGCPEISKAIQKVAFKNGYEWYISGVVVLNCSGILQFGIAGQRLIKCGNSFCKTGVPALSIPDCIARLKQPRTKRVKVRDAMRCDYAEGCRTSVSSAVRQAILAQHPDLEIELPA